LIPEVERLLVWRHERGKQGVIAPSYMQLPLAWRVSFKMIFQLFHGRILSLGNRQHGR
jgi:hypothetical protein